MLKDILKLFNTTHVFGPNISEQHIPSSADGYWRILTDPPLKLAFGGFLVFGSDSRRESYIFEIYRRPYLFIHLLLWICIKQSKG